MIIYCVILLIVLFLLIVLKKKQYEYNNVKCLVVICGGARTFYECIDSQYKHVISKLGQDVSVLFYLKKTDPGPKGQEGWDFHYDDVESETINNKINQINKNIKVYSNIIDGDEIEDDELLKKVKDRSKYIDFLSDDNHLLRCLHQFYNFKRCGEIIKNQNIDYDYYVFLRPDLFFTEDCFPIEKYSSIKVTLQPDKVKDHYIDHISVIPKSQFEKFFNKMKFIETNTTITFGKSEEIFAKTMDHEEKKFGEFYIKR
jgi:hypothetical protein